MNEDPPKNNVVFPEAFNARTEDPDAFTARLSSMMDNAELPSELRSEIESYIDVVLGDSPNGGPHLPIQSEDIQNKIAALYRQDDPRRHVADRIVDTIDEVYIERHMTPEERELFNQEEKLNASINEAKSFFSEVQSGLDVENDTYSAGTIQAIEARYQIEKTNFDTAIVNLPEEVLYRKKDQIEKIEGIFENIKSLIEKGVIS